MIIRRKRLIWSFWILLIGLRDNWTQGTLLEFSLYFFGSVLICLPLYCLCPRECFPVANVLFLPSADDVPRTPAHLCLFNLTLRFCVIENLSIPK